MLEDIGARLVIENLSGYISGMRQAQSATDAQVKSLGNLGDVSAKARADLDRIIDGQKEYASSLGSLTNVQEMANQGFAGMQGPLRSSTDALESVGRGLEDDAQELVAMTGAIHGTTTGWEKFNNTIKGTIDYVQKHKIVVAAFSAALLGTLGVMVKQAEAQRISQAQLSVALANVGVSYAEVRKELEATMAATARKTGISDEAQREALSELVFTTGNYKKSLEALPVVLDLAAAKGMDASSAARILGRAMAGSTDMLKRYGIYVKEGASATEILATVQRSVAGAAEEMASPFAIMKDQMGEMGEAIGTVLLPPLKLFTRIAVEAVNIIKWFVEHTGFLGQGMVYLAGAVGIGTAALLAYSMAVKSGLVQTAIAVVKNVAHAVSQWAVTAAYAASVAPATAFAVAVNLGIWPLTLIALAIAAVVAGIVLLIKNWEKVTSLFRSTSKTIEGVDTRVEGLKKELADLHEEQSRLTTTQEKAQDDLKILQDEYAHVEENAAGYRDEVKRLNTAIESNKKRMDELADAISDVNSELDDLSTPNLTGMQAFDDQIFDIDQQIKKLKLRELTEGVDLSVQIEGLEDTKEQLELTRDITFDPLTRSAREAVEDIKGLNDEMAPNSVLSRIKTLGDSLATYTDEYSRLDTETTTLTNTLNNIMTVVNNQLETMNERMLDLKNTIYDLGVALRENAVDVAAKEAEVNKPIIHIEPPEPVEVKGIWNMEENPEMPNLFGQKNTTAPTGLFGQTVTVENVNVEVPETPTFDFFAMLDDILKLAQGEAQFGGFFPQMQPVRVGERGPEVVMIPAGSTVQPNQYNTTNYNVNAHYANPQTPQGIGMDLEAIRLYSRV